MRGQIHGCVSLSSWFSRQNWGLRRTASAASGQRWLPQQPETGRARSRIRCRQVAATLHQTTEPDGTGWKRSGWSFVRDSKEISVKVASRKGFLLGATIGFNSRRLHPGVRLAHGSAPSGRFAARERGYPISVAGALELAVVAAAIFALARLAATCLHLGTFALQMPG